MPACSRAVRDFAAWLGLTPRQFGTGGKQRAGGISKQGDGNLRSLLVCGAAAHLRQERRRDAKDQDPWLRDLMARLAVQGCGGRLCGQDGAHHLGDAGHRRTLSRAKRSGPGHHKPVGRSGAMITMARTHTRTVAPSLTGFGRQSRWHQHRLGIKPCKGGPLAPAFGGCRPWQVLLPSLRSSPWVRRQNRQHHLTCRAPGTAAFEFVDRVIRSKGNTVHFRLDCGRMVWFFLSA